MAPAGSTSLANAVEAAGAALPRLFRKRTGSLFSNPSETIREFDEALNTDVETGEPLVHFSALTHFIMTAN